MGPQLLAPKWETIGVTVPLMKRIFEYSRTTKDGTGVLSSPKNMAEYLA
jgi:hypothetical protein